MHVAVVCASIGCPMLRNEAFTADSLEAQLEERHAPLPLRPHAQPLQPADAASSRSRRSSTGTARTSRRATRATRSVKAHRGEVRRAARATRPPRSARRVRDQKADVAFLDYDWSLNDATEALRLMSAPIPDALHHHPDPRRSGRHRRRASRAAAAARAGREVIVVDGGSRDATRELAAPLADRVLDGAARPRRADERRRARGARRRAALPARRHASCRRAPPAVRRRARSQPAARGAASTSRSPGGDPLLAGRRMAHERALAPHRHRDRRPGDLRATRRRSSAVGGFPAIPLMEDVALSQAR